VCVRVCVRGGMCVCTWRYVRVCVCIRSRRGIVSSSRKGGRHGRAGLVTRVSCQWGEIHLEEQQSGVFNENWQCSASAYRKKKGHAISKGTRGFGSWTDCATEEWKGITAQYTDLYECKCLKQKNYIKKNLSFVLTYFIILHRNFEINSKKLPMRGCFSTSKLEISGFIFCIPVLKIPPLNQKVWRKCRHDPIGHFFRSFEIRKLGHSHGSSVPVLGQSFRAFWKVDCVANEPVPYCY